MKRKHCSAVNFSRFGRVTGGILAIAALFLAACETPTSGGGSSVQGDGKLASLLVTPGILSPAFCPDQTDYVINVGAGVPDILITGTPLEASARVSGLGTHTLEVGVNPLNLSVSAAGGLEKIYTVTVNRAGPDASEDASLKTLSIAPGTLNQTFDPETREYQAVLPNHIESLTLNAAANDEGAAISGAGTRALEVGLNKLEIYVSAPAGNFVKYTVNVRRAGAEAGGSDDVSLTHLKLMSGEAELTALDVTNPDGSYQYEVDAEPVAVTIDALPFSEDASAVLSADPPEALSGNRILLIEPRTVTATVTVTAGDGKTVKPYVIGITRTGDSADANLAGLEANAGAFSEVFSANTLEYTLDAPNSVTSVTITATPSSLAAAVGDGEPGEPKEYTVNLTPGQSVETDITVTAENGDTKTYTVTAVRRASGNAKLGSLALSEGALSPAFNANTTSYTATVGVSSLTVTAGAEDSKAEVKGAGEKSLELGANLVKVTVTAANGSTTKTYSILIIWEKGPHTSPSLAEMRTFLESQEDNDADTPYDIILNGQTPTTAGVMGSFRRNVQGQWRTFSDTANTSSTQGTTYLYADFKGKYAALDMSGSSGLTMILHTTQTEAASQAVNRALLVSAVLPAQLAQIGEHAFYNCTNLKSVTLNYDGVVAMKQRTNTLADSNPAISSGDLITVGTTQFANVHADCVFYVPAHRLQAYKDSADWASIDDSKFQAIED